jgi:hypothetical protein
LIKVVDIAHIPYKKYTIYEDEWYKLTFELDTMFSPMVMRLWLMQNKSRRDKDDDGGNIQMLSTLHDFISFANSQQTWECVFAKRSQNPVAHEVAVLVRRSGVDHVWNSNFPENLTKALAFDCNRDSVIMK